MLTISNTVTLSEWEVELNHIRSQGNGGQRVNKVATAIHLRFDIKRSSLPQFYKERLLNKKDHRISSDGVIIIKSQSFRTQEQNKEEALNRLKMLILESIKVEKSRKSTKPTRSSQRKRMDKKTLKGQTKKLRGKVNL